MVDGMLETQLDSRVVPAIEQTGARLDFVLSASMRGEAKDTKVKYRLELTTGTVLGPSELLRWGEQVALSFQSREPEAEHCSDL